jgi:hypothetical protein
MTRRTDWQGLGAALLLALGLHALLARTLRAPPPPHRPEPPAVLQTRALPLAPQALPEPQPAPPQPPPPPRAARARAAAPAPPSLPPAPALLATAPALQWQYRLRQGEELGEARLRWAPAATAYQAQLERRVGERALPAWHSSGLIETGGLAPERFVQAAPGRAGQATNFRREQGLISFSAGSELVPLPPGAQDRLSWMLQLAALLQARPALREPGALIELPVASLRGAPMLWRFEVLGPEDLALPVGPVHAALRLRHLPAAPYEPRIDVWLDPARHHLPVKLRQQQGERPGWELELQHESLEP